DFNLLNRKLTVKDVLESVCKCNPVVGTIEEYNSDAELTFFDFFEALIHCTLILMLEKDEPQVDSVDNKIKTIKPDLTIKQTPDGLIDQEEQLLRRNPELDKTSSSIQCEVETWESCMRNFLNKFLQSVEELQILHNRVYQLN
ncbi:unnamed protein product, partial [Schistosoma mattheei]